jgi:hypothetical protein
MLRSLASEYDSFMTCATFHEIFAYARGNAIFSAANDIRAGAL